jgi:hypothetical protein
LILFHLYPFVALELQAVGFLPHADHKIDEGMKKSGGVFRPIRENGLEAGVSGFESCLAINRGIIFFHSFYG